MKKNALFITLLLCIAVCISWALAEADLSTPHLTYMNGHWYYIDDSDSHTSIIMRNAQTGEESIFNADCSKDSQGNYFNIDGLTNDGKSLIAIDTQRKIVLRIQANQIETLFSFSIDFPPYRQANLALCGDYLFIKIDWMDNLFRLDMRDGASKQLSWQNVKGILASPDNTLLLHQAMDWDTPERLLLIDPKSGEELRMLGEFSDNTNAVVGIDKDNNRIYAAFHAGIWILEQQQWVKVRNVQLSTNPLATTRKVQCADSAFFLYDENDEFGKWRAINLNEDVDLIPINVGGFYTDGFQDMRYMRNHPNQVILKNSGLQLLSAFDLYTKLLAKDDSYDIYAIPLTDGVVKLMDRGLLSPLNGEDFDHYKDALYPSVAQSLTVNQTLFGVLESPSMFSILIKPGENVEPPTSIELLVDFLEHWDAHPANYGQPALSDGSQTMTQEDLLLLCLHQIIYQHTRGQMLWENPKITALLKKIQKAALPPKQKLDFEVADAAPIQFSNSTVALYDSIGLQPPLFLVDDIPMLIPMEFSTILLLNPYAKRPKEAMEYLAYLCKNPTLNEQSALFHTFEAKLDEYSAESIELLEKKKEEADGSAEKQQLNAEIEHILQNPDNYTANEKTLTMYREKIAPQLLPAIPQFMDSRSSISIHDFLKVQAARYLNRQINTEQLLHSIRDWLETSLKEER